MRKIYTTIAVFFLAIPFIVFAAVFLTENFDSYSTGDLNGQGGWSGDASFDVSTTNPQGGANGISRLGDASLKAMDKTITAVTGNKIQSFYLRTSDVTDGGGTGVWFYTSSGATIAYRIRIGVTSGAITLFNGSENTISSGLSNATWYQVETEIDTSRDSGNGQVRVRVDGGTWSSWFNGENNFGSGVDMIRLRGAANGITTEQWDSFTDTTPAADEAEEVSNSQGYIIGKNLARRCDLV